MEERASYLEFSASKEARGDWSMGGRGDCAVENLANRYQILPILSKLANLVKFCQISPNVVK